MQGDHLSACLPIEVRDSVAQWLRPAEFLAQRAAAEASAQAALVASEGGEAGDATAAEGKAGDGAATPADGAPSDGAAVDAAAGADGEAGAEGEAGADAASAPLPSVLLGEPVFLDDDEVAGTAADDAAAAEADGAGAGGAGEGEDEDAAPPEPKSIMPRRMFRAFGTAKSCEAATRSAERMATIFTLVDEMHRQHHAAAAREKGQAVVDLSDATDLSTLVGDQRVAALAALAACTTAPMPYLWEAIYPQDAKGLPRYNPGGKYIVRLHVAGAWRAVVVDDRVPVDAAGAPLLLTSSDPTELWPLLLTKALYVASQEVSDQNDILATMRALLGTLPLDTSLPLAPVGDGDAAADPDEEFFLERGADGAPLPDEAWDRLMQIGEHLTVVYDDSSDEEGSDSDGGDVDGKAAEGEEDERLEGLRRQPAA